MYSPPRPGLAVTLSASLLRLRGLDLSASSARPALPYRMTSTSISITIQTSFCIQLRRRRREQFPARRRGRSLRPCSTLPSSRTAPAHTRATSRRAPTRRHRRSLASKGMLGGCGPRRGVRRTVRPLPAIIFIMSARLTMPTCSRPEFVQDGHGVRPLLHEQLGSVSTSAAGLIVAGSSVMTSRASAPSMCWSPVGKWSAVPSWIRPLQDLEERRGIEASVPDDHVQLCHHAYHPLGSASTIGTPPTPRVAISRAMALTVVSGEAEITSRVITSLTFRRHSPIEQYTAAGSASEPRDNFSPR